MSYKVYRIFNDTMSYFMVSKVKPNICLNLLYCYYTKYQASQKPEDYKIYFKLFENDDYDIEEKGSFDSRELAKQVLKDYICCKNCINTENPNDDKPIKPVKEKKTANISQYNKTKYIENKENFKKYYASNKEKIRTYQKTRYQEMREKLKELEELKNQSLKQ